MMLSDSLRVLSPEEKRKIEIEKDNQNDPLLRLVKKEKDQAPHQLCVRALSQIEQDHQKALNKIDQNVEEVLRQRDASPLQAATTTTSSSGSPTTTTKKTNNNNPSHHTSRTVVLNALKAQEKKELGSSSDDDEEFAREKLAEGDEQEGTP